LQYNGPMASVMHPRKPQEFKVMIIFFAPSNDTSVGSSKNAFDWNPFENESTGNYVKSFLQLLHYVDIDFSKYYLIDMFPHRIWEEELTLDEDDYKIAKEWLNKQVAILTPDRIFVANKAHAKKLLKLQLNFKFEVISHPSYATRNPKLVIPEWTKVKNSLLH